MSTYDFLDKDDEKDLIDSDEIKKINRLLKVIKARVTEIAKELDTEDTLDVLTGFDAFAKEFLPQLTKIAKEHSTEDTVSILTAFRHFTKEFLARLTPAQAKAFEAAYAAGDTNAVLDPALAKALEDKKSLEEQVKELQNTAGGDKKPLQLGGGSDPLEQAKAQLDARPEFAEYVGGILSFIKDAVDDGATEDDLKLRADLAGRIMLGKEDGYKIVQGAPGTAPTIKMVNDARKELNTAKAAQKAAEDALADERNDKITGSLAHQLEQAKNNTMPMPAADQVAKSTLVPLATTLVSAINGAKGMGTTKKIEATVAVRDAVESLANEVGVTPPR